MLTSAADYHYITTTGIEQGLTGNIIPTAEVANCQAPFRFEDFCYICEATKDWSFNYVNIGLNPTYTQGYKSSLLEGAWRFIYESLSPDFTARNIPAYGCAVFLNDNITQMPTLPRIANVVGTNKQYFIDYARNLLFDPTPYMDACQWQASPSNLVISRKPIDVEVPHLLYWILFQPVWQQVKSMLDSGSEYYDSSYTFCARGMKSGTGQWHTSDSGVINIHTGNVVNNAGSYGTSETPYVQPKIINRQTSRRVYYTNPMELQWYSWYSGSGESYQSGYEYCYDGISADAYAYVDFRRDDVLDAYAFVEYISTDMSTYREVRQCKFEHLTYESGRRWSFKCFDKAFAKSLLEYIGADFNNIGTRSSSTSSISEYEIEVYVQDIYVKYNHKYAQGISQQWQWTPPPIP